MYKLTPNQNKFLVELRYWLGKQCFMGDEYNIIEQFVDDNRTEYSETQRTAFNKIREEYIKREHIKV